ncbi:MAG: hypothetical protein JXQ73_03970 [Phycisphaerae bacterium]|nr:hypothetical protein [Phycisphaerae bacterium]
MLTGPAKEPLLGLLLGNGDLGASVWADGETLVFTLGKNDVWDRRYNTSHDRPIVTYDQLIERVTNGTWDFGNYYCSQPVEMNFSPTPKPVAQVRLSGLGAISNLRLRLADATLTFDTPRGQATAFIERARNVVSIRLPARAATDLQAEVFRPRETLDWSKPPPPPAAFMSQPSPENARDPANAPLAPPETGISGKAFWTLQRIPAEPTFPNGFAVATAAILAGAEGEMSQGTDRVTHRVNSTQGPWVTIAVAVRTTRDGDADPAAGACQLAKLAVSEDVEKVHARHASQWKQFWSRSSVEIKAAQGADATLAQDASLSERLFYHNLYLLACCSRPGTVAPSLVGNWIWMDLAPWHGIYMLNYNFQQTFWPAFVCNHAELARPYFERFCQTFPVARKNTAFAYGKDARGAVFNTCDYPIRRDKMMYPSFVYDLTMDASAWIMQHFWRQWQYVGDREFLEQRAYPMMVEVARFYEWFLHRGQRQDCAPYVPKDGRLHVFPTFSPEHWGIVTRRFERNRDSASAIAFIRYHVLATAEAADILERDAEEASRWRKLAQRLPDYPTFETPKGKIFVDVAGAPPIEYNLPVPLIPIFPAEDPTFWAKPEQVEIARRTAQVIQTNGNNSLVTLGVVRARLGVPDSLARFLADVRKRLYPNGVIELALAEKCPRFLKLGIFTENFAAAGVIAEHLLQSHPDATCKPLLRLFPTLPANVDARFAGLVGQGGFEVTAERRQGRVTEVRIASRRGASCRLLNPWGKCKATLSAKGKKIGAMVGEVFEFPTQAGQTYVLGHTIEGE